jgi:hypothetical protein
MCFRRSRYWEERAVEDTRDQRLWDLFRQETERSEPPMPVLEQEEEPVAERDRHEVPVGAER